MIKLLLGTCLVVAASFIAWGVISQTHPVFVATEVIEESRKIGVLTEEMSAAVELEDFKAALVTFAIWGAIVGLAVGITSPLGTSKLPLRLIAGILLGSIGGLAAAYISNRYSRFSEPPTDFLTYWLTRWTVVLLPLVVALGVTASISDCSPKNILEKIIRGGVGMVLGVLLYVFSMGLFTPIEQAQYIFPGFKSNSGLLIVAFGGLTYLLLNLRTTGSSPVKSTEEIATPEPEGGV
ncbi:hypothetical protein SH449x_004748 [Pirellulaceae bacterium SH449]